MNRFYQIALFIIFSFALLASADTCLPKLEIKSEQIQCKTAKDCTLVGDACRSCGNPIVSNLKFKKEIEKLDQDLRSKIGCHLSCEACSQVQYKLICEDQFCKAIKTSN